MNNTGPRVGWLEELRAWLHSWPAGIRCIRGLEESPYKRDSRLIDKAIHRQFSRTKKLCRPFSRERYPDLVFLHGFRQLPRADLLGVFTPNMLQER